MNQIQNTSELIVVHVAHRGEVNELIRRVSARDVSYAKGFNLWKSLDENIFILVSGEGKSRTEISLSNVLGRLERENRSLQVVHLGTAGCLSGKSEIGSLVWIDTLYARNLSGFHTLTLEPALPVENALPQTLISVDIKVTRIDQRKELSFHASFVDMEAHSVGLVARTLSIPYFILKVVSDHADNSQICANVKSKAEFFSQRLADEFANQLEQIKSRDKSQKFSPATELDSRFYLTASQKILVSKLFNSFRVLGHEGTFFDMSREVVAGARSELSGKQLTNLLVQRLKTKLDPISEFKKG